MRLRPKITVALFAVNAVVCLALTLLLYRFIERKLTSDLRDQLRDVAHIGAHAVDVEPYRRLAARFGTLDDVGVAAVERSDDYRIVSDQLRAIRDADPSLIQYVYLLAPTEDANAPKFVVDADVLALRAKLAAGKPLTSPERISHFNQPYDVSTVPLLKQALTTCERQLEPDLVYDSEFDVHSVSAYVPLQDVTGAPLRDSSGHCLGVLGVDVTDRNMQAALDATRTLEIEISAAVIAFALLASIAMGGVLSRSVLALSAVVKRFAAKDFAARTATRARDEIGELGRNFDAMAETIQLHNDHLEELVKQRTKQLMAEKHELALRDLQLAEVHAEVRDARAPNEGRHTGKLLGRFQLGVVLGRGAMGEVYAATDDAGTPCAVKVLATHLLGDEDAIRRFHREARAVGSLETPNIVRMIDVSPIDAGLPYLVMERLEGTDLGALIKKRPVLELDEVVAIVAGVAAGLDLAHRAGVVHRDLKPANVFGAQRHGQVTWKILDFGVSKLFGRDATMTTGHLVGTPGYMAPEQARGIEIDHRVDVYALGVLTYRLLTGRPVVVPGDTPAMLHEVVYRMPPQPSGFVAVTAQLEAVLAVALAKDPDARFATAGELSVALAAARAGTLPPEIEERASAIVRRFPWGRWLAEGLAPETERAAGAESISDDATAVLSATPRSLSGSSS